MKRSKFIEQRTAFSLHQAGAGTRVEEVCRKAEISEQTDSDEGPTDQVVNVWIASRTPLHTGALTRAAVLAKL